MSSIRTVDECEVELAAVFCTFRFYNISLLILVLILEYDQNSEQIRVDISLHSPKIYEV